MYHRMLDFIPFSYYNKIGIHLIGIIPEIREKGRRIKSMAFTVTKDTVIGDVLDYDSSLAEIFFGVGMHCVG